MAKIEELEINRRVQVNLDAEEKIGTVVGRRINNRIEGYLTLQQNGSPQPEEGPDFVQVSFPFLPHLGWVWQTTGLMCPPERLDILEETQQSPNG
jgi:hypothetical protein